MFLNLFLFYQVVRPLGRMCTCVYLCNDGSGRIIAIINSHVLLQHGILSDVFHFIPFYAKEATHKNTYDA